MSIYPKSRLKLFVTGGSKESALEKRLESNCLQFSSLAAAAAAAA